MTSHRYNLKFDLYILEILPVKNNFTCKIQNFPGTISDFANKLSIFRVKCAQLFVNFALYVKKNSGGLRPPDPPKVCV